MGVLDNKPLGGDGGTPVFLLPFKVLKEIYCTNTALDTYTEAVLLFEIAAMKIQCTYKDNVARTGTESDEDSFIAQFDNEWLGFYYYSIVLLGVKYNYNQEYYQIILFIKLLQMLLSSTPSYYNKSIQKPLLRT
jgi:hypothetical protein